MVGKLQRQALRAEFLGGESPNPCPSNLATVIVEDQPVGRAQKRIPVSSFPQDLHRECLPKDHVMPDYVYVLPGRSHFRISKTLKGPEHHATPTMPLYLGKAGSSCPRLILSIPKASPGYCCCPGSPESDLWAQRWCRLWQPQFGPPVCGATNRDREQG